MLRRSVLILFLCLLTAAVVALVAFQTQRSDWRIAVEYGDSEAYARAFEANYTWAARAYEWVLGAALLVATVGGIILVEGIRTAEDLRTFCVRGRGPIHLAASVGALALGFGLLPEMIHDMAMWRPPPWTDSPGVVLFGAITATPVLLIVANVALGLYALGGTYPARLWARARSLPRRILSVLGWLLAAACSALALVCVVSASPFLAPGFLLLAYSALQARAGVARVTAA